MPSVGWPELLIVLVIALVVFGPKRLPDMGRQLGRGLREFKKATSEIQDHFDLSLEDKEDKPEQTPVDARPTAATTVPVAEASVAQAIGPEAGAAQTAVPQAAAADAPEVVEGEVVHEEADQPAEPVAG